MAEEQEYQEVGTNGEQEQEESYTADAQPEYTEEPTFEEEQPAETGAGDADAEAEADADASDNPGDRINASKNDDDERKIFVGGLSWETTVKDLKEYFVKFGDVVDCTLKTDPNTGRSRGFGFVLFSEAASVDKVVNERSHVLHGRNIDPKRAKARGGREPIKKVFVGGLDPDVPEEEIRTHFGEFGKIEEIDLPYDKNQGKRRAFCFITFESEEIVDRVCAETKQKLGGKEVDVKKATPKNDQRGGFGEGFAGRGNRGSWGGRGGGDRGARGARGGARGGFNQNNWGNQNYDYNYYNQPGYGGGYDYNNYGQGYGQGYDYNNYYNQGWGSNYPSYGNYGQGYDNGGYGAGYDYSGWYGNQQSQGAGGGQAPPPASYGKARGRGSAPANGGGYHPYSR